MGWPDHAVSRLKVLWADGLSAAQIAGKMRRSRNAVIGKIFRLGLSDDDRTGSVAEIVAEQRLEAERDRDRSTRLPRYIPKKRRLQVRK